MAALAFLESHKPFHLYVDQRERDSKGGAHPNFGIIEKAYLSKKLDPVGQKWPACSWTIAATLLLVKDAGNLIMGQGLVITTPLPPCY